MLIIPTPLAYISVSEWLAIFSQVFGGCCFNVFMLENILSSNNTDLSLGTIVTFSQFLFISIVSFHANSDFKHSTWKTLFLRKPAVPLYKWFVMVIMFTSVSLLNNLIWKFDIGIPFHIVFRSSGTVITMSVGYLFANKRYSRQQVMASFVISAGTILTTLQSAPSTGTEKSSETINWNFVTGILLLLLASIISAFMGIYSEILYKEYGNQWRESLFYTHFLALPLFAVVAPVLKKEFVAICDAPVKVNLGMNIHLSRQLLNLMLNVVSQFLCIKGVNMLAGKTSALTVTVVLLVRKFLSLLISIVWFGNSLTFSGLAGASLVFLGALQYGISTSKLKGVHAKAKNKDH